MKLYFSGLGGAQRHMLQFIIDTLPVHRALVSYAYPQHMKKLIEFGFDSLYLDSGAFSAFRIGTKIVHDEYLAWATERKDLFEIITALDVIGDYEGSVKNYDYAVKFLDVWPVYHIGEPKWVLDHYMAKTNHMCVGGIASGTTDAAAIRRSLHWIFSEYPNVKMHVLGVNAIDALLPFPIYSSDAMTWRSGSRFGDAFIHGRRYKIGRTAKRSSVYYEAVDHLMTNGLDIENPDFDWNDLDRYNIKELYQMLEVDHQKIDHKNLVQPSFLF